MKIVSLVPSATEALFALGLGAQVVGVTHECDYPPEAEALPKLTRSVLPPGLPAREIDRRVQETLGGGQAIYELDAALLAALQPDLIVTQEVCTVCAVSYNDVLAVAARVESRPRVLALDPATLGEALADIERLAEACGVPERGKELADELGRRIERVERATAGVGRRPRVVALEWLDPPWIAGHWVPQMIALAGGEDVLGMPGEPSRRATWEEIALAAPEVVVVMPCGYRVEQAGSEALRMHDALAPLGARVVAVDASAYFSRPGPRLADGIELLGHMLHRELVASPGRGRAVEVDLARAGAAPSQRR
ncbi:cobalamin-binding protein [Thermoleophilum album]|uniref:cobalamin-binding protein n=1 Tax=Thermoleophilum album TaxID=29539 RepID=UPI00237CF96E|nr:cobalamin-binding protein [Thermoleophilum album]WDT93261.1 cobalamin-binding protein [Thermoleophilum album]